MVTRVNNISYYGKKAKIKGGNIMFKKLKEGIINLKERINEKDRPLTDEEILEMYYTLTKEEKQMYARFYKDVRNQKRGA